MWKSDIYRRLEDGYKDCSRPHNQNELQPPQPRSKHDNWREGVIDDMCFPYDICHCRDTSDRMAEEDYRKTLIQLMKWEVQILGYSPTYYEVKEDLRSKGVDVSKLKM